MVLMSGRCGDGVELFTYFKEESSVDSGVGVISAKKVKCPW
jgi:hypothetical protein